MPPNAKQVEVPCELVSHRLIQAALIEAAEWFRRKGSVRPSAFASATCNSPTRRPSNSAKCKYPPIVSCASGGSSAPAEFHKARLLRRRRLRIRVLDRSRGRRCFECLHAFEVTRQFVVRQFLGIADVGNIFVQDRNRDLRARFGSILDRAGQLRDAGRGSRSVRRGRFRVRDWGRAKRRETVSA